MTEEQLFDLQFYGTVTLEKSQVWCPACKTKQESVEKDYVYDDGVTEFAIRCSNCNERLFQLFSW